MARKANWDEATMSAIVAQINALLEKRGNINESYKTLGIFHDAKDLPNRLYDQVGFRYCPLYLKNHPEYAGNAEEGYPFHDPDLLRTWMNEHLTEDGRKRVLNAARQRKFKRGHALTTVTLNTSVFRQFRAWAEKHQLTLDDALERLVETAANTEAADTEILSEE